MLRRNRFSTGSKPRDAGVVLRCLVLCFTLVRGAAIPKTDRQHELQRLVRLPAIDFPTPLHFDRTTGFSMFPVSGAAALKAAELLRDAKGLPDDAPLFLKAARILASGGDLPNAIRGYAKAADLYSRKAQNDPANTRNLVGLGEAFAALGRFGEAEAALARAALADSAAEGLDLAYGHLYKEKAWGVFAGEENRFSNGSFLEVLEALVRRGDGSRLESARNELRSAARFFDKLAASAGTDPDRLLQIACFRSFRAGLQTAFAQIQKGENAPRDLRRSVYDPGAIALLIEAAGKEEAGPDVIASAIAAAVASEQGLDEPFGSWAGLGKEPRTALLWRRLQQMAGGSGKESAEASEYLACVQLYLMKDFSGAERNFRAALRADPARARSWELLVYAAYFTGDTARLVDACEERSELFPNARSSVLLAKACDRQGDAERAGVTALAAAAAYPNDFLVNLTLAAVLLKREDASAFLWRADEALTKAEKQLGPAPTREARWSFVLLKSVSLALSGKPAEARALVERFARPRSGVPEAEQVLKALED